MGETYWKSFQNEDDFHFFLNSFNGAGEATITEFWKLMLCTVTQNLPSQKTVKQPN